MERTITSEERIKRAHEIYQRRRENNDIRVTTYNVNSNVKAEYGMFKKLILQIVICILIYFIFYLIKSSNYFFSEEVINKTKQFLAYDINFQNIYENIEKYYNNNLKGILDVNDITEENTQQVNVNNEEQLVNQEQSANVENSVEQVEGGIGGGEDTQLLNNELQNIIEAEETKHEEKEELTQMQIDANEIKEKYNFILPLKGTVTSRFGLRTPTEIVSANHAGIDIGVNEGTVFVAAMEGRVTDVSAEGGYGNHVYIQNGDVITLYAHCKTIYVKIGESISQGQKIGEVGATGNATGPHLHFEIRKSDRVVNPEYILTF